MAKASISKRTVDGSEPADRTYFVWDDKLPGFGLKVTSAGGKTYVYQYRSDASGRADKTSPTRYTIGRHGQLTAEQARKRAQELSAMVALGQDPRKLKLKQAKEEQERIAREAAAAREAEDFSFARLSEQWLAHYEHEKGRRRSSINQAKMVVNNHLAPALLNRPMADIRRADIQSIIDAIPAKQKAMRRTIFAYASVLFGWAQRRGYIDQNPVVGLEKPAAPAPRDRVLSDQELALIWQASFDMRQPFGAFYRLLILTGQRREEVAAMSWSELDRERREWVIPADRSKNRLAHIVPLSTEVLSELGALAGNASNCPHTGYVLTTNNKRPISSFSKAKRMLDEKVKSIAGDKTMAPWRAHDLRRTFATGMQRLGVRFEVTEAILNHVSGARGGIAGVYQRHDWKDEKRAALVDWAERVRALAAASAARPSA